MKKAEILEFKGYTVDVENLERYWNDFLKRKKKELKIKKKVIKFLQDNFSDVPAQCKSVEVTVGYSYTDVAVYFTTFDLSEAEKFELIRYFNQRGYFFRRIIDNFLGQIEYVCDEKVINKKFLNELKEKFEIDNEHSFDFSIRLNFGKKAGKCKLVKKQKTIKTNYYEIKC